MRKQQSEKVLTKVGIGGKCDFLALQQEEPQQMNRKILLRDYHSEKMLVEEGAEP